MIEIRQTTAENLKNVKRLWADGDVMRFVGFPEGLQQTDENMQDWYRWIESGRPQRDHFSVFEDGVYCGETFYEIDPEHGNSAALDIKLFGFVRGRGVAAKALSYAIKKAFENGAKKVWVDPNPQNIKAIALYERLGFRRKDMPAHLLPEDGEPVSIYMELGSIVNITIKRMETDEEIRGKAYVHWKGWHEAYPGLVSQEYLDKLTLEKCEKMAYSWTDGILIAKDGERVVGFVGYGDRGEEAPGVGEIFAMYVLSEYYGTGVGRQLMEAGLERLKGYPGVCLWVLKDNARAIRFYEKCGFCATGEEMTSTNIAAAEIRMTLEKR